MRPSAFATALRSSSSAISGARRGATPGSPICARASSAGKARKKLPDAAVVARTSTAGERPELAERLDGVKLQVLVVARGGRDQRVDRARVTPLTERQRGLQPEVRIGVLEQLEQRRHDVDLARRQELDGAAQHAEVAMVVAQRAQRRGDHVRGVAPGERLDRGAPHSPTLVAEEAEERIGLAGRLALGEHRRCAQPHVGVEALEFERPARARARAGR